MEEHGPEAIDKPDGRVATDPAPVTPQEIVALLRDMPPLRVGWTGTAPERDARDAWLARKRDLLARIEAENADA